MARVVAPPPRSLCRPLLSARGSPPPSSTSTFSSEFDDELLRKRHEASEAVRRQQQSVARLSGGSLSTSSAALLHSIARPLRRACDRQSVSGSGHCTPCAPSAKDVSAAVGCEPLTVTPRVAEATMRTEPPRRERGLRLTPSLGNLQSIRNQATPTMALIQRQASERLLSRSPRTFSPRLASSRSTITSTSTPLRSSRSAAALSARAPATPVLPSNFAFRSSSPTPVSARAVAVKAGSASATPPTATVLSARPLLQHTPVLRKLPNSARLQQSPSRSHLSARSTTCSGAGSTKKESVPPSTTRSSVAMQSNVSLASSIPSIAESLGSVRNSVGSSMVRAQSSSRGPVGRARLVKQLLDSAQEGNSATVLSCLRAGVDVDERDEHGWSALHHAVAGCHFDVCQALVEFKADLQVQLPDLSTPLMLAADEGNIPLARLLLRAGALPGLRDDDGFTAQDRCESSLRPQFASVVLECLGERS